MRKLFLAIAIVVSLSINAQQGEKNFIDQNYIEVTGKSEMEISPDLIYISIRISEKDSKNKISVPEQEEVMINRFKEMGIDVKEDLLVKDIASNFKNYFLKNNQILLQKEYQLVVREGKVAAQVFMELEELGISNVSIFKLDNSNIVEFRKKVKVDAIKAAKEKAELLSEAVGQQVGRAIYIKELDNSYIPMRTSNSVMMQSNFAMAKEKAPDIDFEKIKLEYSILCKFELK